jgi:hypothetical protein
MKKFYFSFFIILLSASISTDIQAQFSGTYITGGLGGNWSNPATWQVSFPAAGGPPNPCNNCLIVLNGTVTLDAPDPMHITNGAGPSQIIVSPSANFITNTFLTGVGLTITVSNPGTLTVNNEIQLSGGNVILNGSGSLIDATGSSIASTGTIYNGLIGGNGIFYSRDGVIPINPATSHFDALITNLAGQYGQNAGVQYSNYDPVSVNCSASGIPPPTCASGVVYGPANVQNTGTPAPPNDIFQFVGISPLPVTLIKFSATPGNGKSVNVSWSTVQEINSDYFQVERSADATNFQSIGQVSAKGNSSGIVDYTFVDPAPVNAINYYRLKMVDRDAKYEYSKVAKVVFSDNSSSLVVYNNPFHDQVSVKVNLSTGQMLDLKLTDISGRVMSQQTLQAQPGDNFINIRTSSGANGLYILTIKGQTYNQSVKLVKE